MSKPAPGRQPISLSRLTWLTQQLQAWRAAGIIDAAQSAAILDRYADAGTIGATRSSRLFAALCGLAILMFAAAVLLLIGFNWDQITRPVKVAMIFAAVAVLFGVSSAAYARGRGVIGELTALAATLMYGSGIWLLAQVFHIESHYPDGVLWWAIGALAVGHAARSRLVGVAAVVLLGIWVAMEGGGFGRANYTFLPLFAAALLLGYSTRSPSLVALTALCGAMWLTITAVEAWRGAWPHAAMMVLYGAALYAAGLLHGTRSGFGRAYHLVALAVMLVALMPLTFTDYYGRSWRGSFNLPTAALVTAALLAVFTAAGFARRARTELTHDWPVLAAAGLSVGLMLWGVEGVLAAWAFSVLTLVMSVWLIVRGVTIDRALSFFTGVVYMLVFVMVRWIDLIGDMVSAAGLFFVCGLLLLGTAWFWRKRHAFVAAEGVGHA